MAISLVSQNTRRVMSQVIVNNVNSRRSCSLLLAFGTALLS